MLPRPQTWARDGLRYTDVFGGNWHASKLQEKNTRALSNLGEAVDLYYRVRRHGRRAYGIDCSAGAVGYR